MRHASFELLAGRMNINFSVHSSIKQRFSASIFLLLEQAVSLCSSALAVQGNQTIWLAQLGEAIVVLTGVAAHAVYSRDGQKKMLHENSWIYQILVTGQDRTITHLVMPGVHRDRERPIIMGSWASWIKTKTHPKLQLLRAISSFYYTL